MNFGMNMEKYSMYKLYLLSNMIYIFLVSNNHNILTVKYEPEDELLYDMYNRRRLTNRDSSLTNRNLARSTSRKFQNLQMEIWNLQMKMHNQRQNSQMEIQNSWIEV